MMLIHAKLFLSKLRLLTLGVGFAIVSSAASVYTATAQELTLYMVEQHGCVYCEHWDSEVGDAYHKTTEGALAPLVRLQLRDPLPEGLTFARKAAFTPTFILVRDGQELERIEGYPGEDFFYGMLGVMLKKAGSAPG